MKTSNVGENEKQAIEGNERDQHFRIEWDETKKANPGEEPPVIPSKKVEQKPASGQKDFIIQWDETKDTIDWQDERK